MQCTPGVDNSDRHFSPNDALHRNQSVFAAAYLDPLSANHTIDHLDCFFLDELLGLLDFVQEVNVVNVVGVARSKAGCSQDNDRAEGDKTNPHLIQPLPLSLGPL